MVEPLGWPQKEEIAQRKLLTEIDKLVLDPYLLKDIIHHPSVIIEARRKGVVLSPITINNEVRNGSHNKLPLLDVIDDITFSESPRYRAAPTSY